MERRRSHPSAFSGSVSCETLRSPPLRVRLHHEPADDIHGYPTVELSPCPLATAIAVLGRVTSPLSSTLLVDACRTVTPRTSRLPRAWRDLLERETLGRSVRIDDSTLRSLHQLGERRWTIARIDGPLDATDAFALEQAILSGQVPLDADLRASVVMQTCPQRSAGSAVWAQCRDLETARAFIAAIVTHFVARCAACPVESLPPLPPALLRIPASGFSIRPRDVRCESANVMARVRRGNRTILNLVADRSTGLWTRV